MIVLPAERRRAEEFARRLEADLQAPLDTVIDLASHERGLASLATLVTALPRPDVDMSPEVSTQLRRRLVAMAAVRIPEQPGAGQRLRAPHRPGVGTAGWFADRRVQARLSLAAGIAVVLLIAAAVGLAGSRSLPGDPFYGVKRATEAVELTVTRGDLDRGKLHLSFAKSRLSEISALLARDSGVAAAPTVTHPLAAGLTLPASTATHVVQALDDMDAETKAGSQDLTRAWQQSGSAKPLQLLAQYSQTQFGQLRRTLPNLPIHARSSAQQSLTLLVAVNHRADQLDSLGSSCDTKCRDGNGRTAGGVKIGRDSLGAVPCATVHCPSTSSAPAAMAASTIVPNTTAATLLTQLEASIQAFPVAATSTPAPAPPVTVLPSESVAPTEGVTSPAPTEVPSGEPSSEFPTPTPTDDGTPSASSTTPTGTPLTPTETPTDPGTPPTSAPPSSAAPSSAPATTAPPSSAPATTTPPISAPASDSPTPQPESTINSPPSPSAAATSPPASPTAGSGP